MMQPGSDTPHFCYNPLAACNYKGTKDVYTHKWKEREMFAKKNATLFIFSISV